MTKKQLTIMHVISNLYDGGAEGALYRLCLHLPQYRHVVVCMMNEGKYGPMLMAAGVTLYCLKMPQGRPTFYGVWRLMQIMRTVRPDLVQTWMYHADLLGGVMARLCRVKKVYWGIRHSNLSPGTVKRSTIQVAKICAFLANMVPTRIISCSQQAAKSHIAIGYAADRMIVIPNGYELSRYAPNLDTREDFRNEFEIHPDIFLLGMVARFDRQKDHANFFRALQLVKSMVKPFHCVLVGTGMTKENSELQNMLKQYDIFNIVTLLGRRDDVPRIMNGLDLHVLSSLGEAFPNVLAEAMACGTLCATTDVGDAAYIVGETGWVTPPQDPTALANLLCDAIKFRNAEPKRWKLLQKDARERIEQNFSIERMAKSYETVWKA